MMSPYDLNISQVMSFHALVNLFIESGITDYRQRRKVKFPFYELLVVVLLAHICGRTSAVEVADFAYDKHHLFKAVFNAWPDTSPSHDTITRLYNSVDLQPALRYLYMSALTKMPEMEMHSQNCYRVLALDGQAPRSLMYGLINGVSIPKEKLGFRQFYLVSLFDCDRAVCVDHEKIFDKENENKASLRLVSRNSLDNAIVTCDALNTTKDIISAIESMGGHFCMAVKANRRSLYDSLKAAANNEELMESVSVKYTGQTEIAHGREETRSIMAFPACHVKKVTENWPSVNTIFVARTESKIIKTGISRKPQIRYFISSVPFKDMETALLGMDVIRKHWGIENKLHYNLDNSFSQDRMVALNKDQVTTRVAFNKLALNFINVLKTDTNYSDSSIKRIVVRLADDAQLLNAVGIIAAALELRKAA